MRLRTRHQAPWPREAGYTYFPTGIVTREHVKAIGNSLRLYLYIINRDDCIDHVIPDYRPEEAEAIFHWRTPRTIRRWFDRLVAGGYIEVMPDEDS